MLLALVLQVLSACPALVLYSLTLQHIPARLHVEMDSIKTLRLISALLALQVALLVKAAAPQIVFHV